MAGFGRIGSQRRLRGAGSARQVKRARIAFKSFAVFGLLTILVLFVGVAGAAPGDRAPGGRINDPVVRAVDVAEPSIVRIAALYLGRISFDLCGATVTLPAAGEGYLTGGVGTGAFVSANGDILTADHVVDIPSADLDAEIFQSPTSAADIAHALNSASCIHFQQPVTATDVEAGLVQYDNIPFQTQYSDPQRVVWQSTDYSGPAIAGDEQNLIGSLMNAPHFDATLTSSSSFDENDLALLHVDLTDTPSIQLADSAAVATEDSLTILGFPGNGDVSTNATDLLIPSVNTVSVSAIKSGTNGEKLIQVSGNVEHGDSGGPALDSTGAIVGVVSFGGTDFPGSTAFLRTSDSARALIQASGVNVTAGTFETSWRQAFADYAATYRGHWHTAARELDALSAKYPSFAGIKPYRDYADSAARTESTSGARAVALVIFAGAGLLLALAVALVVILLLQRRSSKSRLGSPQFAQGWYQYPYNPYGYAPPAPRPFVPVAQPYTPPADTQRATTNQTPTLGGAWAQSGWPASSTPASAPISAPTATEPAATPNLGSDATGAGVCENGHGMSPSEIYCAMCGARRGGSAGANR